MRIWSIPAKLVASAAGIVVVLLTSEARTPENLMSYLHEQGYGNVMVASPSFRCGKNKSAYRFTGQRADGHRVSGNVCMGGFKFLYDITLDA
jgi:hypothetical protein